MADHVDVFTTYGKKLIPVPEDNVRKLFIIAGIIMIVNLPFVHDQLPIPLFVSILIILGIAIFAGMTSAKDRYIDFFDTLLSMGGFIIFQYSAVNIYLTSSFLSFLFLTNEFLALIFFFATYYSVKSLKNTILNLL